MSAVLLLLSCCVLVALVVPPCTGQGSDCSCSVMNSHCDDSGVCRCEPGWDGERCARCVPMPGCVHGSCQQPWQCSCEPGWGGRFCDKDLSVCSEQQPCQNGATCVMEDSGEYTCLCPEGFHGRDCQLKTGPCHQRRSPCKNGGLCEDADGFAAELTCRCLAGFTGPRCETDVDDCLMRPSQYDTTPGQRQRFWCLCPPGHGRSAPVRLTLRSRCQASSQITLILQQLLLESCGRTEPSQQLGDGPGMPPRDLELLEGQSLSLKTILPHSSDTGVHCSFTSSVL
ncbi:protein delta homolog 2 [Lates japonicus]|uniref:Protein delta homolog 2 n=1 Tax=Lates japonicus TaxID=270547 RepID=A0AAD3MM34_LATJO|nr:protein delta homolog 2 [Lates japonicus]